METQAVDISKKLIDSCKSHMDEWHSLKGFVHDMIALGIQTKYKDLTPYANHGETAVKDQLEEGIACKWQSITLKNYEAFGRPKNADREPVKNHPAGKVFKASDIYGEQQ
jgi:hypothetical protein